MNVPERSERSSSHFIDKYVRALDVDDLEDKSKFRSKQAYLECCDLAGSNEPVATGSRNKIGLGSTNKVEAAFEGSMNKRFND